MEGDEVTGPQVPYVNLIQVGLAKVQVEHLVDLPCLTQGESLHCARTARALRATFRLCSPRRAPRHAPWKRP